MRITKIILLSLFAVLVVNSSGFAETDKASQANLCVKGILFDSERPLAIVNDNYMEEGQSVLGAKVIKITERSVQFEYNGEVFSKEVGQGCLNIVSPNRDIIHLGDKKENLKDIIGRFTKLATSKDKRSKADLKRLERELSVYFKRDFILIVTIVLSILFILYIYHAITLQVIAVKVGTSNPWLAWIPIANIYLACKIAGKPGWWLLLLLLSGFIPVAGPVIVIVINIIVWMGISEARNKPAWIGIFSIIPLLNLFMLGYLAFSKEEYAASTNKEEKEINPIDIGQPPKINS